MALLSQELETMNYSVTMTAFVLNLTSTKQGVPAQ